ncbi:MAG: isoprenylcysteine carboxylmethyltransferase family protein [Gemmatimonadaceae bacterium]
MRENRGPNVRFPPPTLFVAAFLIGMLLDASLGPSSWWGGGVWPLWVQVVGAILAALGFVLSAWGAITFRRAGTPVIPMHAATPLVTHGPEGLTRNPMYVGLTLGYVGIALVMGVTWPLILLPMVLWALYDQVIRKEERYLADAFGEDYRTYRARVRRWI